MAAPVMGPTDHFAATNLELQSSSNNDIEVSASILDNLGNVTAETTGLDSATEYSAEYSYDGGTTDFKTALGTLLSSFGNVVGSPTKKIDELTMNFEAGQYPTVSIRGHDHAENGHSAGFAEGTADPSGILPGGTTFGIPTLTGQGFTTGSPQSLSITCRATHVDRVGQDGNHLCGKSVTFMAELSETFLGTPNTSGDFEATGWTTDSLSDEADPNSSNVDFDEFSYTAHRYITADTS